jgi:N-sulfoglucosamine sulfohydrolase
MRRTLALLAALGAAAAGAACGGARGRPPDIVLVTADDLSYDDIEPSGHPRIRTPVLEQLAAAGMRFERAFLTAASCSPSRCSTVTGRYPHSTGAGRLHDPLPADQTTFLEGLRRAGYDVSIAGKWHLGKEARSRFDRIYGESPPGGTGEWRRAIDERPRDRPSFLWLSASDPHRPYSDAENGPVHPPEDAVVPPYLADTTETRMDLARYYAAIERLDTLVGAALAEIDRLGAGGRTLVMFMSDNGRPFPRCKPTVYDSGVRTPLIVRWPGHVPPGSVSRSLVSAVDIAPTFLAAAGLAAPGTVQGRSMLPILADPAASIRDEVYAERNWHDHPARDRMVRTLRYKYIRNFYPDLPAAPPEDVQRSPTWRAMETLFARGALTPEQTNCFVAPRPIEELYDVEADPDELVNLAGDPARADALRDMRRRLETWQRDTDDRDTLGTPPPGGGR